LRHPRCACNNENKNKGKVSQNTTSFTENKGKVSQNTTSFTEC